jgi:hypothetical protein
MTLPSPTRPTDQPRRYPARNRIRNVTLSDVVYAERGGARIADTDSALITTINERKRGNRSSRQASTDSLLNLPSISNRKERLLLAHTLEKAVRQVKCWKKDCVFNMSVKAAVNAYGEPATESLTKEMLQFVEKDAFAPIHRDDLTDEEIASIIPSLMFVKVKNLPNGTFDKIKSRLVARGDKQDKSIYNEDLSSGTIDSTSVMVLVAIAASEQRKVAVMDIGGAYLNADMPDTGPKVHMRTEPRLAKILADAHPEYRKALGPKGELILRLRKAVYGCIESAKLWNDYITASLNTIGFVANAYDPCVLNWTPTGGKQCTVGLHVDDLIVTCECQETIEIVIAELEKKYKDTKVVRGPNVPYLGMDMDFSTGGQASITMDGMIESIIRDSGVASFPKDSRHAKTPASEELFEIDEQSPLLDPCEKDYFHTFVAKMLYLAKRVRPECLTTVAFLTTRVTKSTKQGLGKLRRLLRYLEYSQDQGHKGIRLTPGKAGVSVRAYIDAAYGVHADGKSHTGCSITIGEAGPVDVNSTKQPIVTKSRPSRN